VVPLHVPKGTPTISHPPAALLHQPVACDFLGLQLLARDATVSIRDSEEGVERRTRTGTEEEHKNQRGVAIGGRLNLEKE